MYGIMRTAHKKTSGTKPGLRGYSGGHYMEIIQVEFDSSSTILRKLIEYARACSWRGTGQYFADLLEDGELENSERVFVAVDNDNIAGFVGLIEESCVDNTEYSPWIDFLFVDEAYRKQGIARMLIEHTLIDARRDNIDNVYLCTTSHEEMYKKFGFHTLYKTKINGGDECTVMKIGVY